MTFLNSNRTSLGRWPPLHVPRGITRLPFLAAVVLAGVALHAGCAAPDSCRGPLDTRAPLVLREAESVRAAVEEMMAPVRIGMSETELRSTGCVEDRTIVCPLPQSMSRAGAAKCRMMVLSEPSQLDTALHVKTTAGVEATVALAGDDRRVKLFRTSDPSFVVYDCIHVGSTYQELLTRLEELGVTCSEPFFHKLMGAVVVAEAEPWLHFYFLPFPERRRSESPQRGPTPGRRSAQWRGNGRCER